MGGNSASLHLGVLEHPFARVRDIAAARKFRAASVDNYFTDGLMVAGQTRRGGTSESTWHTEQEMPPMRLSSCPSKKKKPSNHRHHLFRPRPLRRGFLLDLASRVAI